MKRLILVILLLAGRLSSAQLSNKDNEILYNNIRLVLAEHAFRTAESAVDKSDIISYFNNYVPKISPLKSEGFDSIFFFKVNVSRFVDTNNRLEVGAGVIRYGTYFDNVNYEFVVAYHPSRHALYRLKGFAINDYPYLRLFKNQFEQQFVEGIDLRCLEKAFKNGGDKRLKCLEIAPSGWLSTSR